MKSSRQKAFKKGFTLVEIMVVIIILGLLAVFVVPSLTGKSEEAKQKLVCVQMKSLSEALKMFKMDNGSYPTSEQGLNALLTNPDADAYKSFAPNGYLEGKNVPNDPWKNPYIYTNTDGTFDIMSLGADAKEGGTNENKDTKYSECHN